jgi:site-specific recombinase XerD
MGEAPMIFEVSFAPLLEQFFTERLMRQRQASAHTISSYRDCFRQLLKFIQSRLHKPPCSLMLADVDTPLLVAFLEDLEKRKKISARTRNLRLTAVRSFFQYAALEAPTHSAQIQRVLAIPNKRFAKTLVPFLTRPEVDALLAAPDQQTWSGRRDHAFMLTAVQTGLRLSEMTGLKAEALSLGAGSHVRVMGKGRKERCTPLAKSTRAVLKSWMKQPPRGNEGFLFPSALGARLSVHGVQYILNKHRTTASKTCSSLATKRVTVHRLRHTTAMDLMQEGTDRSTIALWLGHESVETTQIYLDATLAMKEKALEKIPAHNSRSVRYRPTDQLLAFLGNL